MCGCFYCREIFAPNMIVEWICEGTAFCPMCGIDSVIGDASGYEISKEFLSNMNDHWF